VHELAIEHVASPYNSGKVVERCVVRKHAVIVAHAELLPLTKSLFLSVSVVRLRFEW